MPDPTARIEAAHQFAALVVPGEQSLTRIARMAATIFETSLAAVSLVDAGQIRIKAGHGLDRHGLDGDAPLGLDPGLCASAVHSLTPYVVTDASCDPRTANHPLVRGEPGLRFYAAAAIIVDGQGVGTVAVLDRKRHRRVAASRLDLLTDLATTVADLLTERLSVQRAEQKVRDGETERQERTGQLNEQAITTAGADESRPRWCQLGGTGGCRRPAEAKVADSWGDSAWGCWPHAEEALFNVAPAFLATESIAGLGAFRARNTPPS
jgi:GAF domain-containing protein